MRCGAGGFFARRPLVCVFLGGVCGADIEKKEKSTRYAFFGTVSDCSEPGDGRIRGLGLQGAVGSARAARACRGGRAVFGGFQALMPLVGYLLGIRFQSLNGAIDHWIAFLLLGFIGFGMIRESRGEPEEVDAAFGPRAMLPLAVATSIDALAVGVTFAFLGVSIVPAVGLIGCVTCIISVGGIYLGRGVGEKFQSHAEFAGGAVLILLGCKILLEHLGIL